MTQRGHGAMAVDNAKWLLFKPMFYDGIGGLV